MVLSLICLVAATLLAGVNQLTIEPIKGAEKQLKMDALAEIFPFKVETVKISEENETVYYELLDGSGTLKGVGIETFTNLGYSGRINVLLAVSPEGTIYNYKVVYTKETPGLGSKLSSPKFKEQFKGKSMAPGFVWKVKKDQGDVDAITAATISSRAIIDALVRGLNLYEKKYK
ncbi:MAG TPA: RnfABCDGE type electron transport complex subunit G [Syntrophales bacterium]|nr:RnfABCDGE type electron transport complex subunit G [Syntrophales bacterium]